MLEFIKLILDWSEVWAVIIPLSFCTKQPGAFRPVVWYLWIALIINLLVDLTWKFRTQLPAAYNSNNYLYNLHSLLRFFLFSLFFNKLKQPFFIYIKKVLPVVFLIFLVVNFRFYEHFFNYWIFSSRLLSVEAFLLLFYCLQYYIFIINEDINVNIFTADFWIVTGLGIYMTINFFIFLLYNELTLQLQSFAISLWNVHNISFVVFNLFLAKGLYDSRQHK
jgi:hypothetical protein